MKNMASWLTFSRIQLTICQLSSEDHQGTFAFQVSRRVEKMHEKGGVLKWTEGKSELEDNREWRRGPSPGPRLNDGVEHSANSIVFDGEHHT